MTAHLPPEPGKPPAWPALSTASLPRWAWAAGSKTFVAEAFEDSTVVTGLLFLPGKMPPKYCLKPDRALSSPAYSHSNPPFPGWTSLSCWGGPHPPLMSQSPGGWAS